MDPKRYLRGKRVLIVDDEEDILELLVEHLEMCKVDTAKSFEDNKKGIPALMLTAHALSKDNLKKSFEKGASYYVPKDEIDKIDVFLADILEARDKDKNVFVRWYERLGGFCDRRFGPDWKDDDPEFWNSLIKY
jgi:CheY-like chemotaxis protein